MKSESPMTPDRASVKRLHDIVSEETSRADPDAPVPATLARIRQRAIAERLINPNDDASDVELFGGRRPLHS